MLKSQECQTNFAMRKRYADKVFSLLRIVAKALKHLHSFEIIHGSVSLENCGRFKTTWKLTSMIGSQRVGEKLSPMRLARAAPPESIISVNGAFKVGDDLAASCAQDVWGFGKMAYDILVGDQLVMFDDNEIVPTSQDALAVLHGWDDLNIDEASQHLARVGVSEEGINLISHCLAADPGRRPPMDAVLQHPCWKSLRR
jgi:serine/threonine protein kinase